MTAPRRTVALWAECTGPSPLDRLEDRITQSSVAIMSSLHLPTALAVAVPNSAKAGTTITARFDLSALSVGGVPSALNGNLSVSSPSGKINVAVGKIVYVGHGFAAEATVTIQIPKTFPKGNFTITASYAGTQLFSGASASATCHIVK